jgi:CBS domain-containing protein
MIRRNIHHLVVTEGVELVGVVTNHDFMLLQGTSPLSILKNIDRQKNAEDLIPIRESINQTIAILLKEGVRANHILRIITELHDRLIMKIIDLTIDEIGSSHCPFAFFVYGSEGRREETFKTVFRCAVVYDDERSDCEKADIIEYCRCLIRQLQETFGKCGLPLFDTLPLGEGVPIYGNISDWESNILTALSSGNIEFSASANKMLDSRAVYGNELIVDALKDRIYKRICDKEMQGYILQDDPAKKRSTMGFFKKFFVDEKGEQLETLDIKQKGISQIVESLRAMAIRSNIHETSTIERLNILSQRGLVSRDLKSNIHSAFEFMLHLLLQSQLMKKESNEEVDNIIDPENLSLLEKKTLKEAFQLLPDLREKAKNHFKRQDAPGQ